MTFKDDLIAAREEIVGNKFEIRDGTKVPVSKEVGFNEAVKLQATYLYADMVDSSGLVAASPGDTVGKVMRLFLDLSVRIIHNCDGHIRSFDGDRVMGVFIGDGRMDRSVQVAMQIKWACDEIIQPELNRRYRSISKAGWELAPGTGIANGDAFLVRGGVRRTGSDLVSVGIVPNMAAKLGDIRHSPYHVRIGANTYGGLSINTRDLNGTSMWEGLYTLKMGGKEYKYYRSSYRWRI